MRERAAENEATRLDTRDPINARGRPGLDELIDDATEHTRIAQKRRDIAEGDAGLGVIRDRANGVADFLAGDAAHAMHFTMRAPRPATPGYGCWQASRDRRLKPDRQRAPGSRAPQSRGCRCADRGSSATGRTAGCCHWYSSRRN